MIGRTLYSSHNSGIAEVTWKASPSHDIVQESRVLRSWMFPGVEPLTWKVEECICDSKFVFRTLC